MPGTAERMPSYRPPSGASHEQPSSERRAKRSYPPESHPAMKGSPLEYKISLWLSRRASSEDKETQTALQNALNDVFDIVSKELSKSELALLDAEATAIKGRTVTGASLKAKAQISETKNPIDVFEILKESVEFVARRAIKEFRAEKTRKQ